MSEMTQFFFSFLQLENICPHNIISFAVLVPVNMTGRSLENVKDVAFSDIDNLSISNIAPESDR